MSERNQESQEEIVTGSVVGSPRLETTESGREFLMMTIYDRSERREYEVAVLDQASRNEVADLGDGDVVTVQGDYRPGEEVNAETGVTEIKHRLVAKETFTDVPEMERIEQMTPEQFADYSAALSYDVHMEAQRERDMEDQLLNDGAEQSLQDFLAENPDTQKGPSREELEAQRLMTERLTQLRPQPGFGVEGPPF